MIMGVGETARLLDVTRDQLKSMAYHFRGFLSTDANPGKEMPRQFSIEDIRVLSLFTYYWEESPDIENITWHLNVGSHHEGIFDDLVTSITPVFQDPPDNLDETWRHGVVVGGMAGNYFDNYYMADCFLQAGDTMVDAAFESEEPWQFFSPICFNYRHAIELYLKASCRPPDKIHDLKHLYAEFVAMLKKDSKISATIWLGNLIEGIYDFDPDSTTFRYGEVGVFKRSNGDRGEFWVDLAQFKRLMQWTKKLFTSLRKIQGYDADATI